MAGTVSLITTREQGCAECYISTLERQFRTYGGAKQTMKTVNLKTNKKKKSLQDALLISDIRPLRVYRIQSGFLRTESDRAPPAAVDKLNKSESKVGEIRRGIHLQCTSWLRIKINKLSDTYRPLSPPLCLSACPDSSARYGSLAALRAPSQNSIINVRMDLLQTL